MNTIYPYYVCHENKKHRHWFYRVSLNHIDRRDILKTPPFYIDSLKYEKTGNVDESILKEYIKKGNYVKVSKKEVNKLIKEQIKEQKKSFK